MSPKPCHLLATTVLASASVFAALPVAAQPAQALDEIIVTAERSPQKLSQTSSSVVVIRREDIEKGQILAGGVSGLIASRVPGFSVSDQSISGASEGFRGRGTLVMVDGVPRNIPLRDVSRILSLIDLDTIERIEVVNGASSLHGSGATGGTINFITRKDRPDKPRVTARFGTSLFTANPGESIVPEGGLSLEGRQGVFDYLFSASGTLSRLTFDGKGREMPSDGMLGQGGGDRLGKTNLSAILGYNFTPTQRFEVSTNWSYAEQRPEYLTNYTTNPGSPAYNRPYTGEPLLENSKYVSAQYTHADTALGAVSLRTYYNDIIKQSPFSELSRANSQVYYSGNPLNPTAWFNQTKLMSTRTGVNLSFNTALPWLPSGSNLAWGADYTYDTVKQQLTNGQDAIAPMSQHGVAAFVQANVPLTERWRISGGARFEHFSLNLQNFRRPTAVAITRAVYPSVAVRGGDFTYSAPTFNAGTVFDIGAGLQAHASFSQGFSLADIGGFTRRAGANSAAELCAAYGFLSGVPGCLSAPTFRISYANIAPDPQIVNNYEMGLRGRWGKTHAFLTGYVSTSDKGLTYDPTANRISQQKERIWGVELSGVHHVTEAFALGGLLAYQDGLYDANRDGRLSSREHLPNNRIASTWRGMVYGAYQFTPTWWHQPIGLRAEVEFFSGRDKIPGQKLDGAALFNAMISTRLGRGDLQLGVRNLLDTSYINPTATATRNAPVAGLGRTLALGYRMTF